jgi:hypothetical protein
MNFGPNHYVAVLKLMEGERAALAQIAPHVARNLTPLLEVTPLHGRALEERLRRDFKGLVDALRQFPRFMVDAGAITGPTPRSANKVFSSFHDLPSVAIPVLSLGREAEAPIAHSFQRDGVAIRVGRAEFESTKDVAPSLVRFVDALGGPRKIDLIVDLGSTAEMLPIGIVNRAAAFLRRVPMIGEWRTLSLLSNCFPRGLGGLPADHLIERADFVAWRDYLQASWSGRRPTFGDGGIQHGDFFEKEDDAVPIPTANIRYAREVDWVTVKGVKATGADTLKNQMPRLAARLLASGQATARTHCAGCLDIARAARQEPGAGYITSSAWRRIGAVHHITTTVAAIQSALVP